MSATRQQEADDSAKPAQVQVPATETADEHDSTTLKFDGPVRISDEEVGGDPYNRTGRFKRLIRG